ncbi:hypothetical protein CUU62_05420 [Pseudomonas sp. WP001]|nr:hypothetical protein CUU62_05420 [Pseudomonas sp. WP001]
MPAIVPVPFDRAWATAPWGEFLPRLLKRNYVIQSQARFSTALMNYSGHGPVYPLCRKIQAGLNITDCRAAPLYQFNYPTQLYAQFSDVPPLMVRSLLFIENRALLDPEPPRPTRRWTGRALPRPPGRRWRASCTCRADGRGSTLATQLEKYRHSPDGLTLSGSEKLRQMLSASVRAYQHGTDTLPARQNVVRDYLNSVPLSAVPGHGEVHGMAEGLRVWYGADFARSTRPWPTPRTPRPVWRHGVWRCAKCCR